MAGKALARIGIVADVQFADCDNVVKNSAMRYYRDSLRKLSATVRRWRGRPAAQALSAILQLGDLFDGRNAKVAQGKERALQHATDAFSAAPCPVFHVIGNHELYMHSREQLLRTELHRSNTSHTSYFSVAVHEDVLLVVLDTFDVSLLDADRETYDHALALLRQHNPNDDLESTEGLTGLDRRWNADNGAIGPAQLAWLRQTLSTAADRGQRVILAGHVPLCPGSSNTESLIWNYEEVLEAIHTCGRGAVVACFNGHDHDGGYHLDQFGVHHVTFAALLECDEQETASAVATIYSDAIHLEGSGKIESRVLPFAPTWVCTTSATLMSEHSLLESFFSSLCAVEDSFITTSAPVALALQC